MTDRTENSKASDSSSVPWDDDDAVIVGPDDVRDFNPHHVLPESAETQASIRGWLQPTAFDAENGEYRKHLASHLAGTGDWILDSPTFKQWHDSSDHGMLWIKGIPGSGKSVVAASLVDHLSQEAPTLYFFFRQIIDANHSPIALLRDWLAQLLIYSPPLQANLKERAQYRRDLENVSMNDIWRELKTAFSHLPRVYCVVDALDEMDSNDVFLQALAELGRWNPSCVKVLVTSRPVASVERPLRQFPILSIRLEEKHVDCDIAEYVEHRLRGSPISSAKHSVIKKAVPGRANGIFLYAKLAMDAFLEDGTDAAIDKVLETLPEDLNIMYTNLLHEHARRSGVPGELQLLILSWVTHASRPLRLLELAEMIRATERKELAGAGLSAIKDLVRSACGPLLEILPDETISVVHHSLTEFLKGSTRKSGTASGYPTLDEGTTHSRLAVACVSYLLSGCLDDVGVMVETVHRQAFHLLTDPRRGKLQPDNEPVRLNHPFLAYGLENWHVHVRKAQTNGQVSDDLFGSLLALFSGHNMDALLTMTQDAVNKTTPLHVVARFGLSHIAARLLESQKPEIDAADHHGETPLLHAAGAGHASVVKVLLAHGAKPDEPSAYNGLKPLHLAAGANHGEVVDVLLAAGVDPLTKKTSENPGNWCGNAPRSTGHTALMYAMNEGHTSAAKAFIPHLKDSATVSLALTWAAQGGHADIVAAILEHPLVDVNAKVRGDTPLFLAAKTKDIQSMVILLKAGADPSITSFMAGYEFAGVGGEGRGSPGASRRYHIDPDSDSEPETDTKTHVPAPGFNALHALCGAATESRSQHYSSKANSIESDSLQECFQLMLEAGVDVNLRDEYNNTALYYASSWSPSLVRLLLSSGADAKAETPDGSTLLHDRSDPTIVRLLVEEGKVDINHARRSDGKTPMLSVANVATADLIRRFVDLGADLTVTDSDGNGALHSFCKGAGRWYGESEHRLEAIDVILGAGVQPHGKNHQGETPMHLIAEPKYRLDVVSKLITAGADLNAQDNRGRTVLFNYVPVAANHAFGRPEDFAKALQEIVDLGARPDLTDFEGKTLLFVYVTTREPKLAFVSKLAELGVDVEATDHQGNTPCHELAKHLVLSRHGTDTASKVMLELQLDANQRNNDGQLPLHLLLVPLGPLYSVPIALFKNVDVKDHDGIRPIHIAARCSERRVVQLLDAGACSMEPTREGITPLHVAARFRQANIVGILLEAIEARVGKQALAAHLNRWYASDVPSALHIACRSGSVTIVSMLLAAGSNPNMSSNKLSSPLMWCTKYEEEESLWQAQKPKASVDWQKPPDLKALGIKINDRFRGSTYGPTVASRLEEVLKHLVLYGADMVTTKNKSGQTNLDRALLTSANNNYTLECLLDLRRELEGWERHRGDGPGEEEKTTNTDSHDQSDHQLEAYATSFVARKEPKVLKVIWPAVTGVYRRSSTTQAFILTEAWKRQKRGNGSLLKDLISRHEWQPIRHMLQHGVDPFDYAATDSWGADGTALETLVSAGLDSIVRDVISRESLHEWQQKRGEVFESSKTSNKSFRQAELTKFEKHVLPYACQQSSSMMPMLRLLVEDLGVNVDVQDLDWYSGYGSSSHYAWANGGLHHLASGDHWWQVAEGLPYLIDRGANLELRNMSQQTPLLLALESRSSSPFRERAARKLIESGADVNATPGASGKSCLSLAIDDIQMTKLLVSKGATVTAAAIFDAIKANNAPVLEALLSGGADPNMRREVAEGQKAQRSSWYEIIPDHEHHSLFYAAVSNAKDPGYGEENNNKWNLRDRHVPIIEILLQNGADPFAKFKTLLKLSDDEGDEIDETLSKECTLLHEVLEYGGVVEPLLEWSDLDLEHRDAKGRTLLLAACRSRLDPDIRIDDVYIRNGNSWRRDTAAKVKVQSDKPTPVELLLQRGACVTARDNGRRNALHSLLATRIESFCGYNTLRLLISHAPELVHQVDAAGETPLHYALRRQSQWGGHDTKAVEILLENGAYPHPLDAQGNTALHHLARWLAEKGQTTNTDDPRDLFKRFVSLGLSINARDSKGETPAFAFIREQGKYRSRAYDKAEDARQLAGLEILADAGADFLVVNDAGENLLHVVAATDEDRRTNGNEKVMLDRFQWLLERGLDPMAEDGNHRSSLDVAAVKGNEVILK